MRHRKVVYLSGGMRSGWQRKVKEALGSKFIFLDPTNNGQTGEQAYTLWDTEAVRECDIIFVYAEKDNPSFYGLSLEVGVAKATGKTIIMVDEAMHVNAAWTQYGHIVRCCADVVTYSLVEGINILDGLAMIWEEE
jgi:hypothetical protein